MAELGLKITSSPTKYGKIVDYRRFLAERASRIESSPIRVAVSKIAELTANGKKVISLAAGDPDPDIIPREKLAKVMLDVMNDPRSVVYTPTQGWPDVRKAISSFYDRQFGMHVSDDNVLVTTGGEQALDLVAKVLCDLAT